MTAQLTLALAWVPKFNTSASKIGVFAACNYVISSI